MSIRIPRTAQRLNPIPESPRNSELFKEEIRALDELIQVWKSGARPLKEEKWQTFKKNYPSVVQEIIAYGMRVFGKPNPLAFQKTEKKIRIEVCTKLFSHNPILLEGYRFELLFPQKR